MGAFKKGVASFLTIVFIFAPVLQVAAQELPTQEISGDLLLNPPTEPSDTVLLESPTDTLEPGSVIEPIGLPDVTGLDIGASPDPVQTEPTEKITDEEAMAPSIDGGKLGGEAMSASIGGEAAGDVAIKLGAPFASAFRARPSVDRQSGAMAYTHPIRVPEGRLGLTPEVILSYSSHGRNQDQNWLGNGWGVSIPKIERMTRHGTNQIYSPNKFQSSISGDLVHLAAGYYGARIEKGDFIRYDFVDDVWTAKTKEGLKYTYGTTTAERMDNPANPSTIFAWYLSSIEDANGNSVRYEYDKVLGQVYPKKIVYTNAGAQDGIFQVEFVREAKTNTFESFRSAFGVTTTQRIARIDVKTNGQVRDRYQIAYTSGDNAATDLISSITETGFDLSGTSSTLPATAFAYRGYTPGWTTNTDAGKWVYPTLDSYHVRGKGVIYADVNGDGLADIVTSRPQFTDPNNWTYVYKTFINNGFTWVEDTAWVLPMTLLVWNGSQDVDGGVRLADMTGDGLLDVVAFGPQKWSGDTNGNATYYQYVFRNTGSGWTRDTNYSFPTPIVKIGWVDSGARIVDVNGDGLSDVLISNGTQDVTGAPLNAYTYLNQGYSWSGQVTDWAYPAPIHPYFPIMNNGNVKQKPNIFFVDLNGDGLQDILWEAVRHTIRASGAYNVTNEYKRAYINSGSGWIRDDSYAAPVLLTTSGYFYSTDPDGQSRWLSNAATFNDVNGDGLTDILHTKITWLESDYPTMTTTTVNSVHLNTGHGWLSSTTTFPANLVVTAGNPIGCCGTNQVVDQGVRVTDFDGDGIGDFVQYINPKVHLGSMGTADVLTRITIPTGGVTDVEYMPAGWNITGTSTRLNPLMPSAQIQTVAALDTKDASTTVSRIIYSYEGGWNFYLEGGTGGYDENPIPRVDRTFAGFAKVTESDGKTSTTLYYHQGNGTNSSQGEFEDQHAKIGLPYREEVRQVSGSLYEVKISKWDRASISVSGSECCRYSRKIWSPRTVTKTYDGGASNRGTATARTYDDKGNPAQLMEYGEATVSDDGTFTDTGADTRQTDYEYATGTLGLTSYPKLITETGSAGGSRITNLIYDGAATGTVVAGNLTRQTVTDGGLTVGVTNRWTYDTTGVPLTKIGGRGETTSYSYDAYKLRAATTTNALSQTKAVTWDYAIGSPTRVKDVNGAVQRATYDAFGRLKNMYGPNSVGQESLLAQHDYVDTPGSLSMTRTEEVDGTNEVASRTHYDGLGREIQSRRSWPGSGAIAKDTSYNLQGSVDWTSLPYSSSGLSKTSPTSDADLKISHLYDALGRVATTTDALGASANVYDRWITKSTDRLGRQKTYERDAYGRLIKVTERLGSTNYDTTYEYDWVGNLKKITDASGNVRNFTYDLLGRRLTAQDLHHSSDATFATEAYAYDANNNVTSRTRPGGAVLAYSYDALNRLTQLTASGTVAEQYSYDSCAYGTGRVCSETSPDHTRLFEYDVPGRVASSTLLIDGRAYSQQNRYTLNGMLSGYTAPDGQSVGYVFDTDKVASVASKEVGSATTTLVSAIGYHPSGLTSSITYGNGAETTNTYDADHLYRLSQKMTTANAATVQNLSYTYDVMGNVTAMSESAGPAARSMTYAYDGLDRLLSATGTTATSSLIYAEQFSYDILGNILRKLSVSPTSTTANTYSYEVNGATYANPHAATTITAQQGTSTIATTSYVYDWRGNPVSSVMKDGSEQVIAGTEQTYEWDTEDQMRGLVLGSGSSSRSLEYVYGGNGDRLKQGESGATSTIYSSKTYNETLTASGTVADVTKHVFAGQTLLATIDGSGASARALYDHTDHLSGASVVTAPGGSVEETLDYRPYGSVRIDEKAGDWSEQRKFAGHEFDDESGLSYMEARYYNPETGRFLNIDPAFRDLSFKLEDPQSMNSYAYARNNPLAYVDIDGREPISIAVIVGAGLMWTAAASLAVQVPLWVGGTDAALRGDDRTSQQLFGAQQAVGWGTLAAMEVQAPGLMIPAGGMAISQSRSLQKIGTTVSNSQNNQTARSYSSFGAYKRGEGPAGPGMEWHHIVEQNSVNKAKFSPYELQSTENIVSLTRDKHKEISRIFSTNVAGSGSGATRTHVSQKSFQEQYDFGRQIMSKVLNSGNKSSTRKK